jgi:hypothetical protein
MFKAIKFSIENYAEHYDRHLQSLFDFQQACRDTDDSLLSQIRERLSEAARCVLFYLIRLPHADHWHLCLQFSLGL